MDASNHKSNSFQIIKGLLSISPFLTPSCLKYTAIFFSNFMLFQDSGDNHKK